MKMLKPEACKGCVFYKRSKYFVPDKINPDSKVMIIAQNPGNNEEKGQKIVKYEWSGGKRWPMVEDVQPQPLIGSTGYMIATQFWGHVTSGIDWEDVSLGNVIKCRVDDKNTLPPIEQRDTRLAILHCTQHHMVIPPSVRYILSLGQVSLWYTTRQKSVEDWRGYALPFRLDHDHVLAKPRLVDFYFDQAHPSWHREPIVMPTFHPASLFKGRFDNDESNRSGGNKRFFHAVHHDFKKFGELIRGEWPLALPSFKHNQIPKVWPSFASFDTEYNPDTLRVYMWSLADAKGNVYVIDSDKLVNKKLAEDASGLVTLVEQNLLADVRHLPLIMNTERIRVIEDTMFAHSVLWTGEPHDLSYILSMYGKFNRHKHLGNIYPPDDIHDIDILYAGLDAYTTLHHAWHGMLAEFRKDEASWKVYREYRLPLAYLIGKSEAIGIKVDAQRLRFVEKLFDEEITKLQDRAKALVKDEYFNLGSHQQVSDAVYEGEDYD